MFVPSALQGCVWLEQLAGDLWYLGSLAIDPRRQTAGLGKILLCAAEQCVTERGGRRVRMSVVNVRLRDDLSFVVLEKKLSLVV